MKKLLSIFLVLLTLNSAFGLVTIGISNLTTNTSFTVVASYWKVVNSDGSDTGGRNTGPGSLPGPGGYTQIHNDDPYGGQGFSYHLEYEVSGTTSVQTYDSGYMAANAYADCFLNGVTPPVYTNYTYCITNNDPNLNANVTFHFQSSALQNPSLPILGTIGYNEYATLTPGSHTCFTTPSIEVSPTADVWSASLNSTTVPAPFNSGTNADGSPNLNFNNSPQGGGTSGTFSGTGGTTTSTSGTATTSPTGGTITNAPVFAPGTNSDVLFQAPQGLASESTLNSGFQLVHSDNINLLTGEKIINDTLTAGNLMTMYMTNALGQIVANTYRMGTNSDQVPTLLRSVTNLLGNLPTNNAISLTLSNYATETTLQSIENAFTNSVGLTNTDFSATLASQFQTNGLPSDFDSTNYTVESLVTTNYTDLQTLGNSYENPSGGLGMMEDFISSFTPDDIEENWTAPDMTYTFPGGTVMDFNPMNNAGIAEIFSAAKVLFEWLMAFFYLHRCAKDSVITIALINTSHGATTSNPVQIKKI
jgi:hypothetical protein